MEGKNMKILYYDEDVEECCKFILKLVKDNFSYMFFDAFLEEVTKDKKVE
jgi:hypothetical protein